MSERPDPSNAGNPDPLENNITGLEPGGGVPPGETPPAESSTAWQQQGHADEETPSRGLQAVWLTVIGIVVLLVLVFIVGNIVGLFNMF
jgi:hypothetical protein